MYITYVEYRNRGGTLNEESFKLYAYEASQAVRTATFDRIATPSEAVKRCVTRLIGLFADEEDMSKNVTSCSNDGLTQSYKVTSNAERKRKRREIIRRYLMNETDENGVPLLFCGVVK